jgi:hypothetical protein
VAKTTTSRRLLAVLSWGVAPLVADATPPPSASFAETSAPRGGPRRVRDRTRSGITYWHYMPRYGHCLWW